MQRVLCSLALLLLILAGCGKDDPPTRTPSPCPDGTVEWNNHCYEAVLAPGVSWQDAQAACEARGGHLATITSADENAFVFSLVSGDSTFWYLDYYDNGLGPWLGGYQVSGAVEPAGGWRWVTNEPFVYTNWEDGQPDNAGTANQNLLRFFKAGGLIGGGWDDSETDNPADHRNGYVFERD